MPPKDGDGDKPAAGTTPSVIDPVTGKPTTNIVTLNQRPGDQAEVPAAPALDAAPQGPGVTETSAPAAQHTTSSPSGHLENPNWWALPDIVTLAGTVNAGTLGQIANEWAQLGAGFDDLTSELSAALQAAIAEAWSGPAADAALAAVKAFNSGALGTTYDFQSMYQALTAASASAQDFVSHTVGEVILPAATGDKNTNVETAAARAAMYSYYVSANRQTDSKVPQFTQPVLPAGGIPSSFSDGGGADQGAGTSAGGVGGTGGAAGAQAADGRQQPTKDGKGQGGQGDQTDGSGQQLSGDGSGSAGGMLQIPQSGGAQQPVSGDSQERAADFDPGAAGLGGGAGDGALGDGGVGSGGGGIAGDGGGESLSSPTLGGALAGTPVASGPGRAAGATRGAGPVGMPGAGGAGRKGGDKEHKTAEYLYGRHNGEALLADDRAVMPAVIGADLVDPSAGSTGEEPSSEGEQE